MEVTRIPATPRPADERIDSVKISVRTEPPQEFDVQLRRNVNGCFIKIVKQFVRYGSKVNIPISSAQQLINALMAVHSVSTEGKEENEIIDSQTFSSEGDNTFLVECFVGSSFYLVRIAKKRLSSRKYIGVTFPRDAVVNFVDIIRSFIEKVNSGLPPIQIPPEGSTDQSARFQNGVIGGYKRNFGPRRPRFSREGGYRTSPRPQNASGFDSKPLASITELAPVTINLDRKVFRVDAVKGNRSFIRISEYIGQSKKGTLHIPAMLFTEFAASLSNVSSNVQKLPQDVLKDAPQPVVQRETEAQ